MAEIHFYEKPGCINNEKQKRVLKEAGHQVETIDILNHPWTREELNSFIKDKPPAEVMNYTAPDIKNGKIDPLQLSQEEAIDLMLAQPILIKRPLIIVEGTYIQGFTDKKLTPYLGDWEGKEDIITCPNLQTVSCDDK